MNKVVPDSERISCEDLNAFLQRFPEVDCCFGGSAKTFRRNKKTVACANNKLRNAINNLEVLK